MAGKFESSPSPSNVYTRRSDRMDPTTERGPQLNILAPSYFFVLFCFALAFGGKVFSGKVLRLFLEEDALVVYEGKALRLSLGLWRKILRLAWHLWGRILHLILELGGRARFSAFSWNFLPFLRGEGKHRMLRVKGAAQPVLHVIACHCSCLHVHQQNQSFSVSGKCPPRSLMLACVLCCVVL